MAAWFGHTQTLTSISKSVSTVASGILGLEDNLATFMKKVIYYDKFFQRTRVNLPKEVTSTAMRLFARCYEYRDEIRDELESSLAYVADAGRWVVGMEDWNSKMEKRLHQISELVLLANSLLVEYAITGKVGGEGSKDELDAYLRNIASSVVLKNQIKKSLSASPSRSPTDKTSTAKSKTGSGSGNNSSAGSATASIESLKKETQYPASSSDNDNGLALSGAPYTEDRILDGPLSPLTSATDESDPVGGDSGDNYDDDDDDDDSLNPFARDYQPPMDKYSLHSSLASLVNESSQSSSIPDLATYEADNDTYPHRARGDSSEGDEPDSPVNLAEYECLDMDSIPKYDAFKPSIRSRIQRMNAVHTTTGTSSLGGGAHMSGSHHSSSSYHSSVEYGSADGNNSSNSNNGSYSPSMQSSFASSTTTSSVVVGEDRPQLFAENTTTTSTTAASSKISRRRPNRIMDMNYSYDFQREQDYNPFISPPATFLQAQTATGRGGGIESISELDLSHTPKIDEEEKHTPPHLELESQEQRKAARGGVEEKSEVQISSPFSPTAMRLSDQDETEALIAALAAASEDDYNLFGEVHE